MLNLEQQIFQQLEKSSGLLIVLPANCEQKAGGGDFISAALALKLFLQKTGKLVDVACYREQTEKSGLEFLPDYDKIIDKLQNLRRFIVSLNISQSKISQIKYTVDKERLNFIISPSSGWFKPEDVSTRAGTFKYDLIITIGATDLEALGKIYDENIEFFYKTNLINIDNQAANEEFGQINYLDLNAVAVTEILFYLLKNYQPEWLTEDVSTCLLTGIIQRTKNFKTTNLTPRTLLASSELVALGARREEIIEHLFRVRDLPSLKLWGRLLNNLRSEEGETILWSSLSLEDFKNTGAKPSGLQDIVDELITNVPQAKLVAIFYEEVPGQIKIILYSLKNTNALELLKEYSPNGTIKIAQAGLAGELRPTAQKIISELKDKLDKLKS